MISIFLTGYITITDNLEWDQHVSEISCKATLDIGFSFAQFGSSASAYKTLVRPHLEYAAQNWHPYNDTETEMVVRVQVAVARKT